jgi:hypothetical protein
MMLKLLYILLQCSWGVLQTTLGLICFLFHIKDKHYFYHGAIVTEWKSRSSVSLGMFVFITNEPFFYEKLKDEYQKEELSERLLVHEYGHTIQSIILGPLYLILMGIPSTIWGFSARLNKLRREKNISYFAFFTEKWANHLGEMVTNKKSMELLLID